jgi:selenocysteine-specific elongation factor
MLRLVVGTAGHIDHGKTTLLRALTGIEGDRLAEEKARGITIDLGFAHFQEGDVQVGFIDVPGHERFLHNALAGLGGIRLLLLVVAADEGVMPQTREHLAIAQLLGIGEAVVALTKSDRVASDDLELARLELEELLGATAYAGAPILAVASTTGDGIPALKELLIERARALALKAQPDQPCRLPIDRSFQLRGLGVVVAGSLGSGRLASGQTLQVLPLDKTVKVRGLQVHGEERAQADAGERVAVQLAGAEPGELRRGDELTEPNIFAAQRTLCARLRLLDDAPAPLENTIEVAFFLHAAEVMAKVRPLNGPLAPGSEGLVEIRLTERVVAIRGDRFVLRRPSPATTLGGGEILDPAWRRRRGVLLRDALPRIERDEAAALLLWVAERGDRGLAAAELTARLGRRPPPIEKALEALAREGKLLAVDTSRGKRYLDPRVCQRLTEKARAVLKTYFQEQRLVRGMPRAELLSRIVPKRAQDLAPAYLAMLQAQRVLVLDGELVNQPGRTARGALTGDESSLAQKVLDLVERGGIQPPSPRQVTLMLDAKLQMVEGIQKFLISQGKIRRLPDGLIFSTAALQRLREDLLATGWERFTVLQFKDHFGLSRKWAIPLLEYLDAIGATRRVDEERVVVRKQVAE